MVALMLFVFIKKVKINVVLLLVGVIKTIRWRHWNY